MAAKKKVGEIKHDWEMEFPCGIVIRANAEIPVFAYAVDGVWSIAICKGSE